MRDRAVQPRTVGLAALALAAACASGCVRREIEITSEPPGAVLTLNGREIGRTPARVQFTFDGTYDVRLRLQGYESVAGSGTTDMPVWDFVGADLVAELAPMRLQRLERWHFILVPDSDANAGLMERAEAARRHVEAMPAEAPDAPAPRPVATPEGVKDGR
ncbi:MAG: PEGA domain-containing protein [Phycisphaerales bacterium]|nr:PEGA domain-containing protein [Phycisphaerales bacterium]